MENLTIYCFPISGEKFVNQLGLLAEVYSAKKISKNGILKGCKDYAPDLIFASSGGNVTSYIGLAADWSDDGIYRTAQLLRSEIFIKSWVPKEFSFIPSWVLGTLNGSLFRKGDGGKELFEYLFNEKTIQNCEIWTGTYDLEHHKSQFFCNISEENSMFHSLYDKLYGSMPLKYLSGNIEKISHISTASATIPIYVEPTIFDGHTYLDGGIMYPSPISSFSSEICNLVLGINIFSDIKENNFLIEDEEIMKELEKEKKITYEFNLEEDSKLTRMDKKEKKKLRLIYFSSYELDEVTDSKDKRSLFHQTCYQILHTGMLQEQNILTNMIMRIAGNDQEKVEHSSFRDMNTLKLSEIFKKIENYKHYILILSPKGKNNICLEKITPKKIVEKMDNSRVDYNVDLWFLK